MTSALIINLVFDLEMANDHWTKGVGFGNFEVISRQIYWSVISLVVYSDRFSL